MAGKNKKNTRETSIVGDIFRILFAITMLVIAILIVFYVFQEIYGFHLPMPGQMTTQYSTVVTVEETVAVQTKKAPETHGTERMPETTESAAETTLAESASIEDGKTEGVIDEQGPVRSVAPTETEEHGPGVSSKAEPTSKAAATSAAEKRSEAEDSAQAAKPVPTQRGADTQNDAVVGEGPGENRGTAQTAPVPGV